MIYTSKHQFITRFRVQALNQEQKWTVKEHCLLPCSLRLMLSFLRQLRPTCLGMLPPTVGQDLLHKLSVKKSTPWSMPIGQSDGDNVLVDLRTTQICQCDNQDQCHNCFHWMGKAMCHSPLKSEVSKLLPVCNFTGIQTPREFVLQTQKGSCFLL